MKTYVFTAVCVLGVLFFMIYSCQADSGEQQIDSGAVSLENEKLFDNKIKFDSDRERRRMMYMRGRMVMPEPKRKLQMTPARESFEGGAYTPVVIPDEEQAEIQTVYPRKEKRSRRYNKR